MKNQYYPTLLCRAGELMALKMLDDSIKKKIYPIIQIENDSKIDNLLSVWDNIEYNLIADFTFFKKSIDDLDDILESLIDSQTNIIPLLSPKSKLEYNNLLSHYIFNGEVQEICYSIETISDVNQLNNILKTSKLLNLSYEKIHVHLNLGQINKIFYSTILNKAESLLNQLVYADRFKSIIVSSGAFPVDLSKLSAKTLFHFIEKSDWNLWEDINKKFLDLDNLNFSDYGIKSPIVSTATFTPTCSIKYTSNDSYVILRGEKSDKHKDGHGQYINHCKELVKSNHYMGQIFSWGDDIIMEKSKFILGAKKVKPGNSTNWVSIGQNHHITFVYNLL